MSETDADTVTPIGNPLGDLRQANRDKMAELSRMGQSLDLAELALLRVDTFLDTLFPDGTAIRSVIDMRFESVLASGLENAASQVRQAQLLDGVSRHPSSMPPTEPA